MPDSVCPRCGRRVPQKAPEDPWAIPNPFLCPTCIEDVAMQVDRAIAPALAAVGMATVVSLNTGRGFAEVFEEAVGAINELAR